MSSTLNASTQPTELSETSPTLSSNLLVPRIHLKKENGEAHLPLEEHVLRRPGQPNLHTYTIPFIESEIHTFIHNYGNTEVSLQQTCFPTHGDCLKVVLAAPDKEVKLPLTRTMADECKGFDIIEPNNRHVLLKLRFLYAPMPAFLPTEHEDFMSREKHVHWSVNGLTTILKPNLQNENTTVLAQMRDMLV